MIFRLHSLKLLVAYTVMGYGAYLAIGYGLLCFREWSSSLAEYAIHPSDIDKKWRLLPFVDRTSLEILTRRSRETIRKDFLGLTLGSVIAGFRYHSRELTPQQRLKAEELAKLMLRKGVGVGVEFVDAGGCTALQGAIIGKDEYVARTLIELGGEAATVGNPNARLKPCRQDAYSLAREQGFPAIRPAIGDRPRFQ